MEVQSTFSLGEPGFSSSYLASVSHYEFLTVNVFTAWIRRIQQNVPSSADSPALEHNNRDVLQSICGELQGICCWWNHICRLPRLHSVADQPKEAVRAVLLICLFCTYLNYDGWWCCECSCTLCLWAWHLSRHLNKHRYGHTQPPLGARWHACCSKSHHLTSLDTVFVCVVPFSACCLFTLFTV